jgi:uncharacterized protein (DUF885 family)
MEENILRAKQLIAKKRIPPKFILEEAIQQIESFLSVSPERNLLVDGFNGWMMRVSDMPESKRAELRAVAEDITAKQVYPAWRKASTLLKAEAPNS